MDCSICTDICSCPDQLLDIINTENSISGSALDYINRNYQMQRPACRDANVNCSILCWTALSALSDSTFNTALRCIELAVHIGTQTNRILTYGTLLLSLSWPTATPHIDSVWVFVCMSLKIFHKSCLVCPFGSRQHNYVRGHCTILHSTELLPLHSGRGANNCS